MDCLVTSPPYWGLRDDTPDTWTPKPPDRAPRRSARIGDSARSHQARCTYRAPDAVNEPGHFGIEATAEDYVSALRQVFATARRVLTPQATIWINLGDSYSTNSDGYWCTQPAHSRQPHCRPVADRPHKNLLGMPWRVALALQEDGWILRNAIVWHKPLAAPTPIRDRLACHHEMIFLFVVQPDYYFDLDPIRQPYTGDRALSRRAHRSATKANTATATWPRSPTHAQRGRNPGTVWTIPPNPAALATPALSPLEIPRRCIAAGSPPGGHILDPFSGSGTTGLAACQLGRRFTGIDTPLRLSRHRHPQIHRP